MKRMEEGRKERRHVRRCEIFLVVKAENRKLGVVCTGILLVGTKLFQERNGAVPRVGEREEVDEVTVWFSCFRDLYV
jgi:hypothetical protein